MKFSYCSDLTQAPFMADEWGLGALFCMEESVQDGNLYRLIDQLWNTEGLGAFCQKVASAEQWVGKKNQTLNLHTQAKVGPARLTLLGGGVRKDLQPTDVRAFAAKAARAASAAKARQLLLVLPVLGEDMLAPERIGQYVAEGVILGTYQFNKYVTGDRKKPLTLDHVTVFSPASPSVAEDGFTRGFQNGTHVARSVQMARDLVNEPASVLTPRHLAAIAEQLARDYGLECEVLGPSQCRTLGMGMFLGVAQGSEEEPRFIHLAYNPPNDQPRRKRVVLVGKGVTFDSGGLSLKSTDNMLDMKVDMAGAAAVLSSMGALSALGCPHEVHALCACTENMPSGSAYKLGDVLTALNGKTVEINNTDAEGRLTLGDALAYAVKEIRPDEIFDFATLTGACMVALGPHTAGVMGNNQTLVERFLNAGRKSGEDLWPLPLPERLRDGLKSEIADMKNTGPRWGGALTAGLFLKEFVADTPWVHVDIAGPATADKEWAHHTKGATGFGVLSIVEYLTDHG